MNATLISLIQELAKGRLCSGEELGESLGVSRAAVWKQVKQLEDLGIKVETVRGRGYRLAAPLSLLDKDKITNAAPFWRLRVENCVNSTNGQLMEEIAVGQNVHRIALLAEMQSEGRGRRGRVWHSPYAANVYLSLAWRFAQGIAAVEGLSLAVGLAVRKVVSDFGVDGISLKWPNDILHDGKKLGGVLLEIAGDASGDFYVVVGIGLNVNMPRLKAEEAIDQPWTDLKSITGNLFCRSRVCASLLLELEGVLESYEERRFVGYKQAWEEACEHINKTIVLVTPTQEIEGVMLGVTSTGALRLMVSGKEAVFNGGEVSLRAVM